MTNEAATRYPAPFLLLCADCGRTEIDERPYIKMEEVDGQIICVDRADCARAAEGRAA